MHAGLKAFRKFKETFKNSYFKLNYISSIVLPLLGYPKIY